MVFRVAVVGSGPSGFYATEALIKADIEVEVDVFERLPAPFGLVRNGVAPDHPKLKQAIEVYRKIAANPEFNLIGNVEVGRDISVVELRDAYHAVIFTYGAETDRALGIPGEDLPGSHTATEFVGWYNGHPDYRDLAFDLSGDTAVVIGQGNVAADVCRILSKTVDELKHTDIAAHALDSLAQSKVRDIYMIGRRGPAQAKFTHVEIREFGELADCDPVVNPADLELNPASETELTDRRSRTNVKNMEALRGFATITPGKNRRCHFCFLESPVALHGDGRLQQVELGSNRLEGEAFSQSARPTGDTRLLDCSLLLRSVGYRGLPLAGLPFDERQGVISNDSGRVIDADGFTVTGCYTAGWIKRGPTGIIGTNRADSVATIKSVIGDLEQLVGKPKQGRAVIYELLQQRGVRSISYADWEKIDAAEIQRGEVSGKPREKFTRVEEMLSIID